VSDHASHHVNDSIGKLNNEVAVGEDIEFQRKWWKFEHVVWMTLIAILLIDIAGGFGKGPLAKAQAKVPDNSIRLKYERIQRIGTPSIMTVSFGPSAVQNGEVHLYVSDSLVSGLGAKRVIPSPADTVLGNKGLTYRFPVSSLPASVNFDLQPEKPGLQRLTLQVAGLGSLNVNIFVFP
jgi:hypothetical protein